jgi:hypothetical protein
MALQARHPLERALHHQLRDALNSELRNPNFFVWIDVRPLGDRDAFDDLGRIVKDTEQWLGSLDPDEDATSEHLPERWERDAAADVKLRAIPKKPEKRSHRADQIVGNPEPILAGFVE